MKNLFYVFFIGAVLLSGCKPKANTIAKVDASEKVTYEMAKSYLSSGEYDRGIDAIERVIKEKDTEYIEELYFLKGFILHAYGETTDARAAYQHVIDNAGAYSFYKNKARQLLDLNIAEEKIREGSRLKRDEEIENQEKEGLNDSSFLEVEKQPRFPDCPETKQPEIRKCSNLMVQEHIMRNYDRKVGNTFGIYAKTKTIVSYTIDKKGKVTDLNTRGVNKFLSLEAKRVLFTLPEMIPGEYGGEIVKVPFIVPVTYNPL